MKPFSRGNSTIDSLKELDAELELLLGDSAAEIFAKLNAMSIKELIIFAEDLFVIKEYIRSMNYETDLGIQAQPLSGEYANSLTSNDIENIIDYLQAEIMQLKQE